VIAHIAGVPAEELLPLLYGTAGLWAAARAYAQSPFTNRRTKR